MDRVPYRRVRTSRYDRDTFREEEPGALGETLILQGIISGVILVAVMVISFINFAPLTPVHSVIRQALAGPSTVRELAADARQFGADVLGWQWLESR
jgi:hypothetical protein